jgi:hypothetical protein
MLALSPRRHIVTFTAVGVSFSPRLIADSFSGDLMSFFLMSCAHALAISWLAGA